MGTHKRCSLHIRPIKDSNFSKDPAEPAFQMEVPKDGRSMAPRIGFVTISRKKFERASNYGVSSGTEGQGIVPFPEYDLGLARRRLL
jgi:hypothetical protein